jgi:energy-coupling factor transporter ATP-binding protein EcfA2
LAVGVLLLAWSRAASVPDLKVVAIRPEGFEDIDCEFDDGSSVLVQTKERGPGARAIAIAELAEIIVHAAPAILIDQVRPSEGEAHESQGSLSFDMQVPPTRLAVVTDGRFGSALPTTGWAMSLSEALSGTPEGERVAETLTAAVRRQLESASMPTDIAAALLARTSLVTTEPDLAARTVEALGVGLSVAPAFAAVLRAELLRDLTAVAARQREASLDTAGRRTRTDVDVIAARLAQAVDIQSLDEAIRAGVCEPADYVSASPVAAADFLLGVDVTPAHIAAGLDVLRPEETTAILDGLGTRRHVVVAGPSGSGKSALLWRTARLLEKGPQTLRVLRVEDADDAEILVRHVRRQMPHEEIPVLVCADDLGRARMAAWPVACRRLLEIPGVLILGAVRQEDVTPEVSADAMVVDPSLTESAAGEIFDAISAAGLSTVLEREEALERAGGLLMEFIALTTTGQRIRQVLSAQIANLAGADHRIERETLRLVCAAHTLGFAIDADSLPSALSMEPDQVGDALQRLAGEHLVTQAGRAWQGLHDLRTEILLELLHTAPPPTLAATYGRAVPLLPAAAHAPAARRAAVRIARAAADMQLGKPARERLAAIQEALQPVARSLGEQLNALDSAPHSPDPESVSYAAGLLEAAERLDAVAYAHAVLPAIEERRPPTLDVTQLAMMVYSVASGEVTFDIPGLEEVGRIAGELPTRMSTCAETVSAAIQPALLTRLATSTDLKAAVRLSESAEYLLRITPAQASLIYGEHTIALPRSSGSAEDIMLSDRRAQLCASLSSLAQLRGASVADTFGPALGRAVEAVSADPFACRVELSFQPPEPVPDVAKNLARAATYDHDSMLVARAVAFARSGDVPAPSAYTPQKDSDPEAHGAQLVLLARRVFDACPEVDLVKAELWEPNQRPRRIGDVEDGVKNLRAGVLRRGRATVRNVAFQAAMAEAVSAETWTTRLREQAKLARDLVALLDELPARLRTTDNQSRRTDWIHRAKAVAAGVAGLPGRPSEQQAVLGTAQAAMLSRTAAELDEEMRRKDRAKSVLDLIAGVLTQVADGLDDSNALRGAGFRLAGVPKELERAREDGAPTFAGIGETLPRSLESLAAFGARLLTSLGQPEIERDLRSGSGAQQELDDLLTRLSYAQAAEDGRMVVERLAAEFIHAYAVVAHDAAPIQPWRDHRVLIVVDAESWGGAAGVLQGWEAAERDAAGVSGSVTALCRAGDTLMPMGLHFIGGNGPVLPLTEDRIAEAAEVLTLAVHSGSATMAITHALEMLVEYSYEQVRRAVRDDGWYPVPRRAAAPEEAAEEISVVFAEALAQNDDDDGLPQTHEKLAAVAVLELCDRVGAETGASGGLASELADIDITALAEPSPDSSAFLFNLAFEAALQADRTIPDDLTGIGEH